MIMILVVSQVKKMKEMPEKFHLITPEPECTNVSFWYFNNLVLMAMLMLMLLLMLMLMIQVCSEETAG